MLRANDACWCGSGQKFKRCHRAAAVRPGHQSPRRAVPEQLARPEYAASGWPLVGSEPLVRSEGEIAAMRRAGRIAAEVLALAGAKVVPGITTDELDALVHEACIARGAYPSPLNYKGFPKSCCTSVNEVVCHGIPDDRPLREGELVDLDVTVFVGGVHGDTSATFPVGEIDRRSQALIATTRRCLEAGIAAVKPGLPISAIGAAIQAEAGELSIVREFVGHGIGTVFHNQLVVPHYFDARAETVIEPSMTFTIEPMLSLGSGRTRTWDDGWTAVTADGAPSAQFEHTLLVTEEGAEVLTTTG